MHSFYFLCLCFITTASAFQGANVYLLKSLSSAQLAYRTPNVLSSSPVPLTHESTTTVDNHPSSREIHTSSPRRKILQQLAFLAAAAAAAATTNLVAQAACLTGDASPDCIGVYKMPLDEKALPYVDTPEKLLRYAPDVRWVPPVEYPKSYKAAHDELVGPLQTQCRAIQELVLKGDLTNAGIQVLQIIPRVTVAGRVVIRDLYDAAPTKEQEGDLSMKAYRAEVAHAELLSRLGQCDVMIGQAIRGEMGAMAPAQIQILSEVAEVNESLEEFLRAIPESITSSTSSRPTKSVTS